jgi:hypothetical protein
VARNLTLPCSYDYAGEWSTELSTFLGSGAYGISRYWLRSESMKGNEQMRLRNFTRSLNLVGRPLPEHLRVEYELWSQKSRWDITS